MMKGLDEDEESALRKLSQTTGVQGYVVLNKTGVPIKSHGLDVNEAAQYAGLIAELTIAAQEFLHSTQQMLQQQSHHSPLATSRDDAQLLSLRLRSTQSELVVTPEDNYTLVVVHRQQQRLRAGAQAAQAKGKAGGEAQQQLPADEDGDGAQADGKAQAGAAAAQDGAQAAQADQSG